MRRAMKKRTVEAEGFYHGTQGAGTTAVCAELQAGFAVRQEQMRRESAPRIKNLEARVETLKRLQPEAEELWRGLSDYTHGMPPQVVLPLLATLAGSVTVVGEGIFLAPVMDGFGIAEPVEQNVLAGVLVLVASGLLKLVIHRFHEPQTFGSNERKVEADARDEVSVRAEKTRGAGGLRGESSLHLTITALLTMFALALVATLGWWRAEELIYAASVHNGLLGDFLKQNQMLTRVCVTLLTLGLPVFVAVFFEWGLNCLSLAWAWRRARRAFRSVSRRLNQTSKQHEAEVEKLNRQVAVLEEERKEWTNAYLQSYELGRTVGAWQTPLWQTVVKIVAIALCVMLACLALDATFANYEPSVLTRGMAYLCAVLGFSGWYAYRALQEWERPTPEQLYRQRATIWRREASPVWHASLPEPNGSRHAGYRIEAGPVEEEDETTLISVNRERRSA